MTDLLGPLASAQGGVFTAQQALAAGYSSDEIRWLLRTGVWRRLRRGVYAEGSTVDRAMAHPRAQHLLRCSAVRLALRRPLVLSHWSAAQMYDLPFLTPPPLEVWAVDPDEARAGRGYRISGASLPPEHVRTIEGWSVTTGDRTVVDVARAVSFTEGVVLADAALRLEVATPGNLEGVVHYCSHFEGVGRAARVCAFADGRAESVLESVSRVKLIARGVPPPDLQPDVYDERGHIGRPDMLWEEFGIVGEADGKVKYTEPYVADGGALWREKKRMTRFEDSGLAGLRWTHEELYNDLDRVVERFWALTRRPRRTPSYRVVSRRNGTSRAA